MTPTDDHVSRHILRPAPPVRAFLIAAVTTVIGAVILVTGNAQAWAGWLVAAGVIILVLGILLALIGFGTMWRMRVIAELTPAGYTFRTPTGVRHGTWADVTSITASPSGHRLTFHQRDDEVQHILVPVSTGHPDLDALVEDLTERVSASRRGLPKSDQD